MVIICFVRSSHRYNGIFSKSSLSTRYQIKEVIALTRVLIPICCSSLVLKFAVLILAYLAFTHELLIDRLFTIIRFCCTTTAIVEPILLLCRHRLLQKRVRILFGFEIKEVSPKIERDPVAVADVYFEVFNQGINKGR
ncbi:hypothetical protein PFISCL1PPCAC_14181, partial [Pristionchus fissidentatus]